MNTNGHVVRTSPAVALAAEKQRDAIASVIEGGLRRSWARGEREGFVRGIEAAAQVACPCCKRGWPRNGDKHTSPLGGTITCTAMNIHNLKGE